MSRISLGMASVWKKKGFGKSVKDVQGKAKLRSEEAGCQSGFATE